MCCYAGCCRIDNEAGRHISTVYSLFKNFFEYFFVIKMMFHSFYLLVFPATRITSPFSASMQAVRIASLRSAMLTVFFISSASSPASISLMMSCGSSKRGLSEVMMTRSLALAASFAMMGRLPLSRLPPAPTTVITFPFPSSTP